MNILTKKITFLMTNIKIRNLLIIVLFAFSLVGALRYFELYEGYDVQSIAPTQTNTPGLLEEINGTTKDTNAKIQKIGQDIDMMKPKETNIEVVKEQV
jgi:hypothetical protein